MTKEALKLALGALEDLSNTNSYWWQEVDQDTVDKIEPTITAIKEALAQPQEQDGCPVCGSDVHDRDALDKAEREIDRLTALVAQPEQEPVALEKKFSLLLWDYQELERAFEKVTGGKWVRKSNTPQRTWVELTFAEICECESEYLNVFARAIEAKLKEKNT